eukprot:GHVU01150023.1.p2 GENE.GHVU01150023.1~~GHVU01150023.1.p2  ORF type:complete len:131 (-),score=1.54 GHVU01150023.1:923-1315(-)
MCRSLIYCNLLVIVLSLFLYIYISYILLHLYLCGVEPSRDMWIQSTPINQSINQSSATDNTQCVCCHQHHTRKNKKSHKRESSAVTTQTRYGRVHTYKAMARHTHKRYCIRYWIMGIDTFRTLIITISYS